MTGRSAPISLAGRIRQAVSRREREIREFTAALVAIPTENPPGRRYRECARLLAEKLRELGLSAETVRVPSRGGGGGDGNREARYCVLSSLGRGLRTLYFHGHYDVVPASVPHQFDPQVSAGRSSAVARPT